MENEYIEKFIKPCLSYLYEEEDMLFKDDLSERCIAFRFAHHLQNKINELGNNYIVDCDYNSSTYYNEESHKWERRHGKPLEDREGAGTTGRFIDIIVHTRSYNEDSNNWSDVFCVEIKKWDNKKIDRIEKDRNNLSKLTRDYGYEFGFYLKFGETKEATEIEIFSKGNSIVGPFFIFK